GQRLTVPLSSAAQREARVRRAPTAAPAVGGATYHTVRAGDSLWVISRRYGVPVADLRSWNGLSDDMLQIGRRLRVAAP
ncbi:MAG TPA: LysM peptidoglycan-binding domain-containing protein, partial [Gemmatimonadales bacterium]|nr:LysM peptidoglycan-binding domain-containing protein [Gemmatimonadales bacterium]